MSGKTVVLSFYARAGANFSASGNALTANLYEGTGTDQQVSSFTGITAIVGSVKTLTTTWQRFQFTGTVSTTSTEVGFQCYYVPTGTASTNDYFEITGIQLELGSTASTFSRTGGNIQGELAACRYYYQVFSRNSQAALGTAGSTTLVAAPIQFNEQMRVAPTVTLGTAGQTTGTISFLTSTLGYPATTGTHSAVGITVSGFELGSSGYSASFTAGNASSLYSNGTSNIYTASAEL
jgi:hypothetical protein